MSTLAAIFTPNAHVTRRALFAVALVEAVLMVAGWAFFPGVLPGPGKVLEAFHRLFMEDDLAVELTRSFKTNAEAVGIATVISLSLAYLTVVPVMRPFVLFFTKWRFFGLTGFSFVFAFVIGGGHPLKVALLVFAMCPFFVASMVDVVVAIPRDQFDYARTLRLGEWRVVWEVVVRGTLHTAFEILRQNAAMGWMMVSTVETLVWAEGGIGTLMIKENKYLRLDAVFACVAAVCVVGLMQDFLIQVVRNIVCPHANLRLERD